MNNNHSESLTCDIALERLDAVWIDPLPDEPLDAELSAAWEHVQDCSACWSKLQLRRDFDRRTAKAMCEVRVPSDLKEKLLSQLIATSSVSVEPSPVIFPKRHRRAWSIMTAALLLVCASSGLWFTMRSHAVSMQSLCEQTPLDLVSNSIYLTAASDLSALPPLPANWLRVRGLKIVGVPRWFAVPNSQETVAWIPFEADFPKQTIRGVLLAVLKTKVLDPPTELVVQPTRLGYTHRNGVPFSIAGWSERDTVFVCFVRGEASSLELLLRRTTPTPA